MRHFAPCGGRSVTMRGGFSMNKIIRHIVTVLPAVLLQVLWLFVMLKWLAPWAVLINTVLSILSLLFVLYLLMKQEESTYKILWLLLIFAFPLPGTLIYLLFGNKRSTRPLEKKLDHAKPLPKDTTDTAPIYAELAAENGRLAQTFRWIERQTGFVPHRNQSATYYSLGDEMFPDILEELKKAEHFIFIEYFIIENGLMWDSMTKILAEKAAKGVDVRVLYDDLGSISTYTKRDAQKLSAMGIRCTSFNPLVIIKGTLNCRDHRKMLIIDGKVAFSGGVNLADEYINHIEKHGHWKDIGFRLTGAPVQNYLRMFAQFWNAFTGESIDDRLLTEAVQPEAGADVADGHVLSYYDSPLREDATSNELYIDLLSQAQHTAWFYTPYLMPGNSLLDAFVRAARRGVDIRIIVPGIPDKKLVYRMTRSFYPVLLEAGVRIYEYTPGFVHAKACIIDGVVGTVGTVNLDYRSLFLHFENNSLFYRSSLLDDLRADFLATQEKCQERTLESLQMNLVKWVVNGVLRILAPLC